MFREREIHIFGSLWWNNILKGKSRGLSVIIIPDGFLKPRIQKGLPHSRSFFSAAASLLCGIRSLLSPLHKTESGWEWAYPRGNRTGRGGNEIFSAYPLNKPDLLTTCKRDNFTCWKEWVYRKSSYYNTRQLWNWNMGQFDYAVYVHRPWILNQSCCLSSPDLCAEQVEMKP